MMLRIVTTGSIKQPHGVVWLTVAGIWPIGKGLATGFIRWRAAPLDLS
jgi:hypothetical protein